MTLNILTSPESEFGDAAIALAEEFIQSGHQSEIFHDHRSMKSGDVLFMLSYFRVLPETLLKLHSNNIVVHASDLPRGKGFSPIAWQIVEGRNTITFCLFEAVKELDAGPVYLRSDLRLNGIELFREWKQLQNDKVLEMVRIFVNRLPEILESGLPQEGEDTIYRRRDSEDDRLDPECSIASQFDLIRVCNPEKYPAWFELRGRRFRLRIEPLDGEL